MDTLDTSSYMCRWNLSSRWKWGGRKTNTLCRPVVREKNNRIVDWRVKLELYMCPRAIFSSTSTNESSVSKDSNQLSNKLFNEHWGTYHWWVKIGHLMKVCNIQLYVVDWCVHIQCNLRVVKPWHQSKSIITEPMHLGHWLWCWAAQTHEAVCSWLATLSGPYWDVWLTEPHLSPHLPCEKESLPVFNHITTPHSSLLSWGFKKLPESFEQTISRNLEQVRSKPWVTANPRKALSSPMVGWPLVGRGQWTLVWWAQDSQSKTIHHLCWMSHCTQEGGHKVLALPEQPLLPTWHWTLQALAAWGRMRRWQSLNLNLCKVLS